MLRSERIGRDLIKRDSSNAILGYDTARYIFIKEECVNDDSSRTSRLLFCMLIVISIYKVVISPLLFYYTFRITLSIGFKTRQKLANRDIENL